MEAMLSRPQCVNESYIDGLTQNSVISSVLTDVNPMVTCEIQSQKPSNMELGFFPFVRMNKLSNK